MFNFDYHNPNDFWIHKYEKHEEDNDEDDDYEGALKSGCFVSVFYLIGLAVLAVACALFSSCTTTKYVTVPEIHEIYHNQTDSVIKQDSVIHEKETTIMQLDSAAMAKYGIQLKAAERAWLVKTKELERQIERLMEMSATKDSVHDSIPVPYEVVKEVPRKRSTTDWVLTITGMLSILGIIVWVVNKVKRFLPGVQ